MDLYTRRASAAVLTGALIRIPGTGSAHVTRHTMGPETMKGATRQFRQFSALMYKNWLLKLRNPLGR